MKILFIKLGALGDVINTLPLAVTLKENMNASIHWLVAPLSYPLVKNHSAVDKVIQFDKNNFKNSFKSVRNEFKETRYDLVLDLQRTLKSGLFTILAKGDRKIGFDKNRCKEMTWLFPFERIESSAPQTHMLDQYLEFAKHLGVNTPEPTWQLPVFGKRPENLPDDYIVLNIGATKPANKWTPKNFAIVADMLSKEKNIRCILTGGPEDTSFADEILSFSEVKPLNLTGKTTVGELSEVIKGALVTISCDTGPMHLAVANNRKIIALFGPSNPDRTGPYKGIVIKKSITCSPCNNKECVAPECMEQITPANVLEQITTIIKTES